MMMEWNEFGLIMAIYAGVLAVLLGLLRLWYWQEDVRNKKYQQKVVDRFFEAYPGLKEWRDRE